VRVAVGAVASRSGLRVPGLTLTHSPCGGESACSGRGLTAQSHGRKVSADKSQCERFFRRGPVEQLEQPGEPVGPGRRPVSRRRFGAGGLSFGGALVVAPLGAGTAVADDGGRATAVLPGPAAGPAPTLRRGSATRAGLLPEHLNEVTAVAERYLGPSPR